MGVRAEPASAGTNLSANNGNPSGYGVPILSNPKFPERPDGIIHINECLQSYTNKTIILEMNSKDQYNILPSNPATYPAKATNIFPNGGLASKKNVFLRYMAAYFP